MMRNWLLALMGVMGLIGAAEGALGPVINGQVYDDVQGISWLQDANLFKTLCDAEVDIANPVHPILVSYNAMSPARTTATVCNEHGRVYWSDAEKFIAALNANRYLGINTWRQPAVLQPDATCETVYAVANPPDYPEQLGGFNCRAVGNELGHLYNIAAPDGLGNPNNAGTGATGGTVGTGCYPDCWDNPGPFINTEWYWKWLGAEYAADPTQAWRFNRNGLQDTVAQASGYGHVWAVHPGRHAAATPIPALGGWGLGIMGLLLLALAWRRGFFHRKQAFDS
jgi:hypothetical protein